MTYRLIIRPEAETELAEAFDWYERRVPGLGADFLAALDAAVNAIAVVAVFHGARDPKRWQERI